MTLLRPYRRYLWLGLLALLTSSLLMHLLSSGPADRSASEGRRLAPAPAPPSRVADLLTLPESVDAYLNDHFGGRELVLAAHSYLRYLVRSPSSRRVAYGREGWLFLADDDVLKQATGERRRTAVVEDLVGLLAEMAERLAREGRRFAVIVPPNTHTIYRDKLPPWAELPIGETEYDVFVAAAARAGLPTIDLRRPLRAAARDAIVYHPTDTHWNRLAALVAYNAVADLAGKPEWRIEPAEALGPLQARPGGDLARFLGLNEVLEDVEFSLRIPDPVDRMVEFGDYEQPSYDAPGYGDGSTVLVIGDSFSHGMMRPFFAHNASRVVWTHNRGCLFDWSEIDRFQPAVVVFEIVERGLGWCAGNRPKNMPARASTAPPP